MKISQGLLTQSREAERDWANTEWKREKKMDLRDSIEKETEKNPQYLQMERYSGAAFTWQGLSVYMKTKQNKKTHNLTYEK